MDFLSSLTSGPVHRFFNLKVLAAGTPFFCFFGSFFFYLPFISFTTYFHPLKYHSCLSPPSNVLLPSQYLTTAYPTTYESSQTLNPYYLLYWNSLPGTSSLFSRRFYYYDSTLLTFFPSLPASPARHRLCSLTMCSDRAPPPDSSVIEPDNFSDNDSTYPGSLGDASYTTSITSSAMNYAYENGRRYHSYHEGEYVLPNDEQEQDRLDLSHHIYRMLFKGELNRAPIKNPARVLDIGTGTGIWAIDYADEHPEAEVIGNDLSPIQPSWIPPNCRFEVDDFEQPWSYSKPFDYIHGRELEGCVRDVDNLFRQALENLKPGGWMEIASMEVNTYSDDDTHLRAKNLLEGIVYMHDCAREYGKDMASVHTWKEKMEKAGFVNVREEIFKLPQSPWPKDPKMKDLGRYHQVNMFEALGPYCYALFTRVMGWERTEIEVFVAGMKQELRDLNNHLYTKVHIVYGQKPE